MITTKKIGKFMLSTWRFFYINVPDMQKKKRASLFNILCDRTVPFKGHTAHAKPMEKSFNELLT